MEGQSELHYPVVQGYRIGEEIGGGGFSKWVLATYRFGPLVAADLRLD